MNERMWRDEKQVERPWPSPETLDFMMNGKPMIAEECGSEVGKLRCGAKCCNKGFQALGFGTQPRLVRHWDFVEIPGQSSRIWGRLDV